MSDKTILVTGGAGFIGSNFARHLYNKYPEYRILVVDALTYAGSVANLPEGAQQSGRYEFWYGDVRNGELMDTLVSRADVVVHMAAESHVTRSIYDNRLFFETDVLGTQTVANAVTKFRDRVERFIHVSTSEVYGSALSERMDEEHPLNPQSPYASAKCGADRLVYSYWATTTDRTSTWKRWSPASSPLVSSASPCACTVTGRRRGTSCTWRITARRSTGCCTFRASRWPARC